MRCRDTFRFRVGAPRSEFVSDHGLYDQLKRNGTLAPKRFVDGKISITPRVPALDHHLLKPGTVLHLP
jgi:hypothetical protein